MHRFAPIVSDSSFTTLTLFDASVNAGVIQPGEMKFRFSIRQILISAFLCAILIWLLAPLIREQMTDSFGGWSATNGRTLIWVERGGETTCAIVANVVPVTISKSNVELTDGTRISSNNGILTIALAGQTNQFTSERHRVFILKPGDDIEILDHESDKEFKSYMNSWSTLEPSRDAVR